MLSSLKKAALRYFSVIVLFVGASSSVVFAELHQMPTSIIRTALSESTPTGIPPADFTTLDFVPEWVGPAVPEVQLQLGERSLEWVRVGDLILIPRAHLSVTATGAQAGTVEYAGFSTPLGKLADPSAVGITVPVALVGFDQAPFKVRVLRGGQWTEGTVKIQFRPRKESVRSRVFLDTSCSPYGVQIRSKKPSQNQYGYVGCRLIRTQGPQYRTSVLELYFYLDGLTKGAIEVDGGVVTPYQAGLWVFRLKANPNVMKIQAAAQEYEVRYFIPEKVHFLNLGLGLGPYTYEFTAPEVNVKTVTGMATLYASYFLSETVRIVAFDATPVHKNPFTDLGLYFASESVKTYDDRLSVNIMLGGHAIWYRYRDNAHFNFGFPQGLEINYRDFVIPGYNFSMGGFIFPATSGKAYYNTWFRYGARGLFGELNYILWSEKAGDDQIYSRSLGISFGFPIARLF